MMQQSNIITNTTLILMVVIILILVLGLLIIKCIQNSYGKNMYFGGEGSSDEENEKDSNKKIAKKKDSQIGPIEKPESPTASVAGLESSSDISIKEPNNTVIKKLMDQYPQFRDQMGRRGRIANLMDIDTKLTEQTSTAVDKLKSQVESLNSDLAAKQKEHEDLQADIDTTLGQLNSDKIAIDSKINLLTQQLSDLNVDITQKSNDYDTQIATLTSERADAIEAQKQLLEAEHASKISDLNQAHIEAMGTINKQNAEAIEAIKQQNAEEIEENKKLLEADRERKIAELNQNHNEKIGELNTQISDLTEKNTKEIDELNEQIADLQTAHAEENRKAIQEMQEKIDEINGHLEQERDKNQNYEQDKEKMKNLSTLLAEKEETINSLQTIQAEKGDLEAIVHELEQNILLYEQYLTSEIEKKRVILNTLSE